jgi:hypothetical protein
MGEGSIVNSGVATSTTVGHVTFPSPIRFTTSAPCILLEGHLQNTRSWLYGFLVKDQ